MRLRDLLLGLTLTLPAGSALAHPHVFIDAGLGFVFDEAGNLTALRVDWHYDELYSLLMIEENGLDQDGDGLPEQAKLDGFAGLDVDWAAGFPGDVTLELDGKPVTLSGPVEHQVRYEGERVVTSHLRPLTTPLPVQGGTFTARAYDPTYFVAYDVPGEPTVSGRTDCTIRREAADRAAAQAEYGKRLAAVGVSDDPFAEIEIPDIGILFADGFRLTCAAAS